MLFVCVLGVRVTYALVISRVILLIPELLPSEARVPESWHLLGVLHAAVITLIMKTRKVFLLYLTVVQKVMAQKQQVIFFYLVKNTY